MPALREEAAGLRPRFAAEDEFAGGGWDSGADGLLGKMHRLDVPRFFMRRVVEESNGGEGLLDAAGAFDIPFFGERHPKHRLTTGLLPAT